jgi:tRNA (cmo5U34)-methyltransferase
MTTPLSKKSTTEDIRERFDQDVDRFSNLETGQQATIDATLAMELITQAAVAATPTIRRVLDIGCGAGNNTLKLLQLRPGFASDLLDLSAPMLDRARQRVSAAGAKPILTFHSDFRSADLPAGGYDVILAAAVLHHLRDDADWEAAFRKIYTLLAPSGSVWITDLVFHEIPAVQELMWRRYGDYLESLDGPAYREKVFSYIDREDSPRPLTYQLDLLRRVGFSGVDVLHKNSNFAAFGAVKAA